LDHAPISRLDRGVAPRPRAGDHVVGRDAAGAPALPDPRERPVYIASEIYRRSTYDPTHPLAVPRVSTCTDLVRAMGWLDRRAFVAAPMATEAEISRFHDADYLAALKRTEAAQAVTPEDRERFRIGADGNPVYAELFRRPATSAGGVMLAAKMTVAGGIAHCPGGGTHHGRRDRASGFCYLNDPVLGMLTWLDAGLDNIVYLDIDAHHGDGVQDAFAGDGRVLTISLHEAGRWPHTGLATDRAGGSARNFPVPSGFNDSEMRWLMTEAVLPLIRARKPQAIFLQAGADALEEDPMARLSLSNNAYWAVADAVREMAPRLLVVGGGGYNPYTVGRCWAGIWAVLNGFPIPARTTPEAEAVLRGLVYNRAAGRTPPAHWFTTLRDAPRDGAVRDTVKQLAELALKEIHLA
jgi:acetoin utilization protein AcuC